MYELWHEYVFPLIWIVAQILMVVVPLLIGVAYLTYAERKVIGAMQLRRGPNVVGPYGLFQPIADGMKLFFKETIIPTGANKLVFVFAPMLTFVLALVAWAVIPVGEGLVISDINVGILYLFAVASLGVYGILMAGWASNSKYAFLGAIRSAAQMVSYEVSMGFVIITVLLVAGSLNLSEIVRAQEETVWFVIPLFPMAVIFFISTLPETNRLPFDMPEAEAELVEGWWTEYGGMRFGMLFMAEYIRTYAACFLFTHFFLGGWHLPFHGTLASLPVVGEAVPLIPGAIVTLIKSWLVFLIVDKANASLMHSVNFQLLKK